MTMKYTFQQLNEAINLLKAFYDQIEPFLIVITAQNLVLNSFQVCYVSLNLVALEVISFEKTSII